MYMNCHSLSKIILSAVGMGQMFQNLSSCVFQNTLTCTKHTSVYNVFCMLLKFQKHNLSPSQQVPQLGPTFENATMLI